MLKFLIFTVVALSAAQVFADPYGMYQGTINMYPSDVIPKGRAVPIVISLNQTDTEITPINPSNAFSGEKKVEGSFVLDSECGPFGFASSEYDLETGKLILQYGRLGSTGSPSSIVNLRIECTLLATGKCEGKVSGVSGEIGTVSLTQTSTQVTPLPVVQKYVGSWKGTINYKSTFPGLPPTRPINFYLAASNGTVTNPDFYEIASTPLKMGADYEGGLVNTAVPYTSIYIDYLRGIGKFTTTSPGYSGSETVIASFQDDGSIVGTLTSSMGLYGTFVAQKEPQ